MLFIDEFKISVSNSTSALAFGRSGRGHGVLAIYLDARKPSGPTDVIPN